MMAVKDQKKYELFLDEFYELLKKYDYGISWTVEGPELVDGFRQELADKNNPNRDIF